MGFVENVNKLAQSMPDDVANTLTELQDQIDVLVDDISDLNTSLSQDISDLDDAKVDKVTGYSLTKNDFSDAYKSKLDGIANNANKYVHPSTHPASIIDGSAYPNQFVKTDSFGNTGFDYASWSEIAGKPSTFTPSSHTHSMSEVTSGSLSATRITVTDELAFVSQAEKLLIPTAEQISNKGIANGYCPLDSTGKINASFLNELQVINVYTADNETEMLLLSQAGIGDICVRTDLAVAYMLIALPSSDADNWFGLSLSIGVTSWNDLSGEVNVTTTNLPEGNNLYFTSERVDDRVNDLLIAGTNITLTYDDISNTLTIDANDTSVGWDEVQDKPTTLSGYGITNAYTKTEVDSIASGKQATLVSGTNIKTINSTTLLGSGNIAVQPTLVSGTNIKTINNSTILGSGNLDIVSVGMITGGTTNQVLAKNSNTDYDTKWYSVQEPLVSGTNIKTINSTSILTSGNLDLVAKVSSIAGLASLDGTTPTVIVTDLDRGGTFIWSSTGTANGGTVFAGATGYWNRQYDGAVNVKWFGAKGDGVTDDTAAIQAALDALPALGGVVYFPGEGPYTCASGVTTDKNLILRGDGKQTTILKYTGNATFIEQTSGDVLAFEEIIVAGDGTTAGPIAQVGSIAYKANNNSYSLNADFIFWYTISEWQGGYYHKHFNSFFRYSKYLFNGYDQNNLAFFGCAFSNFERGIEVASGEGPITFVGGSIELFADKAITSSLGRAVCANLIGTYIEQGPGVACQSGITSATGFYDNGTVIYTNGTEVYPCSFIGCTVFTPGIFRMFWTDSADGCNITGQGNNFISRGGTPLGTIYSLGGTKVRAYLNDTLVGALPAGYTDYVTGLPTDMEGCTVYDPVNGQWLRQTSQGWTNLALQNGFTNDGAPFANASYFQNKDGVVYLRGAVNGLSATGVVIATLPVGYRPTSLLSFSVPSVFGAGSTLQLLVYPSGVILLNGTAPFADQIGLDGVSFYVNS